MYSEVYGVECKVVTVVTCLFATCSVTMVLSRLCVYL